MTYSLDHTQEIFNKNNQERVRNWIDDICKRTFNHAGLSPILIRIVTLKNMKNSTRELFLTLFKLNGIIRTRLKRINFIEIWTINVMFAWINIDHNSIQIDEFVCYRCFFAYNLNIFLCMQFINLSRYKLLRQTTKSA